MKPSAVRGNKPFEEALYEKKPEAARTSGPERHQRGPLASTRFPVLGLLEQRVSLQLCRLLAEGRPAPRVTLTQKLGISEETVDGILFRMSRPTA